MMRRGVILAVLLLLGGAAADGEGDELKGAAKKLHGSARRMTLASRFRERDAERLTKAMADLSTEDLGRVVELLRTEPDKKAKVLPQVLAVLEGEYLTRRYGDEAVERIEDLSARLRSDDPQNMEETLVAGLAIEDFRLAKHLVTRWSRAKSERVRIRVALAAGDLMNYGAGDEEVAKALTVLLDDEDPAVRAMACRRAFEAEFDPVFEWALGHLEDGKSGAAPTGEQMVKLVPGEEALLGLEELTHVQRELLYRQYRQLSPEQKESLAGMFRAWWADQGGSFPNPGFREAEFRSTPSERKSVVVRKGKTSATFRLWSGLDRTRVRLHVDELDAVPSSLLEWEVNFHLRYMASGMRTDDGEGYRRHLPVGHRYVLPRKKIGCYVLVFQVLFGDRVKVHLRFHDPVRVE